MTARDWMILAGVAVGLTILAALIVGGWAAAYCEHPPLARRRDWFAHHRYVVTCKLCQRTIERGRDKTHRRPDGAPGVRRGIRKAGAA